VPPTTRHDLGAQPSLPRGGPRTLISRSSAEAWAWALLLFWRVLAGATTRWRDWLLILSAFALATWATRRSKVTTGLTVAVTVYLLVLYFQSNLPSVLAWHRATE
jgi:hypothetical protein